MNDLMWTHHVLGMMSGTSLDGLDLALCRFDFSGHKWQHTILRATTITYTGEERKELCQAHLLSGEKLTKLDRSLGQRMGSHAAHFLNSCPVKADFIASHGHTVFHQPHNGITLQIGHGAHLAAAAQLPVVNDFRSLDVALGGQGAPLVPIGDRFLFGEYDFCLNLGGIANISYEFGKDRLAFDICPVNMALDLLASREGKAFDKGGAIAESGQVNLNLLSSMNSLDYYATDPPKTLGREWFNEHFLPLLNTSGISNSDKLATCCEHIAMQLGRVLSGWNGTMLVTGGGAWNDFLISRFRAHLSTTIVIPDADLINFKEAVVFAFLGAMRWNGMANTLDSVTGATHASSSGVIWMPGKATGPGN